VLTHHRRASRGSDRWPGDGEHHRYQVGNPRVVWHGWLPPDELARVFRAADVIVAPATRDLPEDRAGDTGMVDGFPSTAARSAMAADCLLVGSNPEGDRRLLTPERDYVEVPERDPEALARALVALLDAPARVRTTSQHGAERVRACCDARAVVAAKLAAMSC
jgi:glycosyltransferase involved in cell wall biosynthesis